MDFWVYILRCSDGSYYIGHKDKGEDRLKEHEIGLGSSYTRKRRPVTLVWSDRFGTREEALAAERQLKGWSRAKKEALIKGNWSRLQLLSRHCRPRLGWEALRLRFLSLR
jgi:predicted GIY-YIG superfamily endonuclease